MSFTTFDQLLDADLKQASSLRALICLVRDLEIITSNEAQIAFVTLMRGNYIDRLHESKTQGPI